MAEVTPVPQIAEAISTAQDKRRMTKGIDMMMTRESEFDSRLQAQLAGMAAVPESRMLLDDALTERFQINNGLLGTRDDEGKFSGRTAIIGSGFSAAVFSAVWGRTGKSKPVVLDSVSPEHIGGCFAVSPNPVFRLNSGDRPGILGAPRDGNALNYLPGGLIQPSMIATGDFHTNADMALVIRLALAQFADVAPGSTVTAGKGTELEINGKSYKFGRVIDARGTGIPADSGDGDRILSFPQFMRKMGTDFPLRGIRRAAVIGDGNSALCAAESLLGIMPCSSPSFLDYVAKVDLYGPNLPLTYKEWKKTERIRYLGIARFIGKRAEVIQERGTAIRSMDSVLVNGSQYDLAVQATGYRLDSLGDYFFDPVPGSIALKDIRSEYYRVGPACDFPFSAAEIATGIADISANRVAMFRYAPRTAALAAQLD